MNACDRLTIDLIACYIVAPAIIAYVIVTIKDAARKLRKVRRA